MAVIRPENLTFEDKKFSIIIYGSPGIGKTTLALSAPSPVLLDFDKGISRVSARHRGMTIVSATYEEVLKDMESPEVEDAESIIIDTGGSFITQLQDWAIRQDPAKNKQKGSNSISLKGFGAVKSEFVRFTNALQYSMNKNVIYVFHSTEEKDGDNTRQRLLCEGAARNLVWQPCDLGCYVHMIGNQRKLGFTPTEDYFAKGCYGISGVRDVPNLTDAVSNDFLTLLFAECRKNIEEESHFYIEQRAAYSEVIAAVSKIVEAVISAEDAQPAGEAIAALPHVLTSRNEAKAIFLTRLNELDIVYSKKAGGYISKPEREAASDE